MPSGFEYCRDSTKLNTVWIMKSELQIKAEQFPHACGVYVMKNSAGEILYVGKAKSLRSRVLSYFSAEKDGRYQVQFLMRKVGQIEPIVTLNEKEALLLENTLIKKHQPRYNIFLKDDKSYLSLKLSVKDPFPRLSATRRIEKDGSLYFGPYTSAFKAREVLDFIEEHFRLRNCSDHDFANRVRPCLQYQIKRCDAPCVGYLSKEAYAEIVKQAILFLQGRNQELLGTVREKMEQASAAFHFEEAARYRDLVRAIEVTLEKQRVVSHFGMDSDALGFYREGERICFVVLMTREGTLLEKKTFLFKTPQDNTEVLENFLLQYYASADFIPREILLPFSFEAAGTMEEILSDRKALKVSLRIPEKGEKARLMDLALRNAQERLRHEAITQESREELLARLQQKLELSRLPRRIECYDISNIQGQIAVGSCVSFADAKPDKSGYRRFKIKTVSQANDFAMLYEVLSRRFRRGEWMSPDLIIIDGGKGQLNAAQAALNDLGVLNVDLISLAKEKDIVDEPLNLPQKGAKAKRPERIFLPGRKNPVLLPPHDSELHLLMQLRDEAHRFGITFHRRLRAKKALESPLDQIQGIGPSRKKALLRYFGSLKRMGHASLEEILEVKGMTRPLAEAVFQKFHSIVPTS